MAAAAESNPLVAVSPLDGRYTGKTKELGQYFSEMAYQKYRCMVEIEYFIELSKTVPQLADFPQDRVAELRTVYEKFGVEEAARVKEHEKVTNHDVKAVEYYIRDEWARLELPKPLKEFIHFGLTSQDVNDVAVPLALKDCMTDVYLPTVYGLIDTLEGLAKEWWQYPMLARTHGQPATPTRLGKEIMVFVDRLKAQLAHIGEPGGKFAHKFGAKFGGATGGLCAHQIAYPKVDWIEFTNTFLDRLGLTREQFTTQVSHYDSISSLFHALSRINVILLDLCKDIWQYISMKYFTQTVLKNEVGSSAMPHKVNPIDFENAEGNFGIANALYIHIAQTLPISRLQRDLTSSTVVRNVGVPIAHTLIGFKSLMRGLDKIKVNEKQLDADLTENWAVVAEAIQTILRREGYPDPYRLLKEATRTGGDINPEIITKLIDGLEGVSDAVKDELRQITPQTFTGLPISL
mmetsp:Transcript_28727/g.75427  ORF Transcript_28727/g.75427 Transcript_28727/m.75427 type:complete len:462 (-) Transcript_28727:52-1437(-)